jgi:hypothetical protein
MEFRGLILGGIYRRNVPDYVTGIIFREHVIFISLIAH